MNCTIYGRFGLMSESVTIMAERGSQDDHMNNVMEDIHKEVNGQQSIEDYEISSDENKIVLNENRNMENKEIVEPERCVSDLVITLVNDENSKKPEIIEEENNEKAEENCVLENGSMIKNNETENSGELENLEADINEKAEEYCVLENSSMTENNETENSGKPENVEADNCGKEYGGAKNNENGGIGDIENDNGVEIDAENETKVAIYNKKENDKQEANKKDIHENDIITSSNESIDGNCDELIADASVEADVRPSTVDNVEEDETAVVPMHHIALQKLDDIIGAGSVPATSRESLVKLPLTHPPQRSVSNPVNPAHFRGSPKAQRPESDRVIKPPSLKGIPVNGASNGSVPLSAPIPPGTESKEMAELRSEVKTLKAELNKARETINRLQAKEKSLADRLSEQAIKQLEKGTKFEDLNLGENRPTQLIRRYGNLHSGTRVDALDALDSLPDIADYDDLKAKLLFSVVVLSFRSVQATLDEMRQTVRQTLYLPNENSPSSPDPIVKDVEDTISVYLRKTVDRFDFKNNVEEVCSQVYATLYDYPSLKSCFELRDYVEECVKLSWALSVQIPHFVIDYDASMFNPDLHTRFHSSNPESTAIQGFLWPSLREGQDGQCVYKGVVIT